MTQQNVTLAKRIIQVVKRGEANCFVLTGVGVNDYVMAGGNATSLQEYLFNMFNERLVIMYDPAQGITFPFGTAQEKAFRALTKSKDSAADDPLLGSLGGSSNDDAPFPTTPSGAFQLIERVVTRPTVKNEQKAVVLIMNLDAIAVNAPNSQLPMDERAMVVRLIQWAQNSKAFEASGCVIVAVAEDARNINQSLLSSTARWREIKIGLPTYEERLEYIQSFAREQDLGIDHRAFARMTAGLSRFNIEDIILRAGKDPITIELITARKDEIIRQQYGGVITIREPRWDLSFIAGKKEVKEWLESDMVAPIKNGKPHLSAKGVVFAGPPGTGKSVLAEAICGSLGIPFIIFDASKVYGKYVGESEKNLEMALEVVEQMGGLLFIDEAEAQFPRRDSISTNDGGVSQRVMTRFMAFMANPDIRGKVLFVLATNYLDKLDDAFIRTGRIDAIIAILIADHEERVGLLTHAFGKELNKKDIVALATRLEGYTGAEILEGIAPKAHRRAAMLDKTLDIAIVEEAVTMVRRSTRGIDEMTKQALNGVNDYSLLSPEWRARLRKQDGASEEQPKYNNLGIESL